MVAKSIREAKSTVTGVPLGRTETGLPPDCGVNVRPVIVTLKEITLQRGASPPKTASVPGAAAMGRVVWPPGPLHPPSRRMHIAATDAIARIYFFTVAYLPPNGLAKARGTRTVMLPTALSALILLNNRPTFQANRPRMPM
jgi:hypothetical protein